MIVSKNIWQRVGLTALGAGLFWAVPAAASAATLSLSPASGSHAAGSTFEVAINLDTGGVATNGTDAILRFDPNTLQVVDANNSSEGTQVLAGSLYSNTTYNVVDNGAGKISFSGTKTGNSTGYSGSGTLATITFQALKAASASAVTFDFTRNTTSDSNVIGSDSTDLLTSVTNGSYTITAASTSGSGSSSGSGTGSSSGAGTSSDSDSSAAGSGTDSAGDDSSGAAGQSGADGTGGSGTVAGTGVDLNLYMILTLVTLVGAGYLLTRRPKVR